MNRIGIIISILAVPLVLIVFFVLHVNILKNYAYETEKSNLIYTIGNRENSVMDIVRDYSSYDEFVEMTLARDTSWIEQNVYNIIEDYDLSGVAVLDSLGKVIFYHYKGGNVNFKELTEKESSDFLPLFYEANILTYNKAIGDSVYTTIVSRLRNTDKSFSKTPFYFLVVNRLNTKGMHRSKVYLENDTLEAKVSKNLLAIALKNPAGQKFGYLTFLFSENYDYIFGKVNIIFFATLIVVVLLILILVFKAHKPEAAAQNLPAIRMVEHEEENAEHKIYEKAVDQNYLGFIITDPMGKIIYANQSFENATLYSSQELIELQPVLFWTENGLPVFNYDFWRRLSLGKAWKGEIFCRRKDASQLRLSATFSPIKKDNYVTGYSAVFEDVTKGSTAEDELKEFNKTYSAILDNCSDTISIYDYEKKQTVFVSPAIKELTGYTQKEFLEKSLSEIFEPSSYQRIKLAFSKSLLENPELTRNGKMRFVCKVKSYTGNYVDVELSMSLIFKSNEDAYPSEIVVVAHDITETQKILKRLSDSQEKYRMIAENTADMIWKVDPITLNINYASNSEERMFGYPKSEFLKMNLRDILPGDALNRIVMKGNQMIQESVPSEVYHRFKCPIYCKNGEVKEFESVVSVITDNFGLKEFLGVTRDITEANRYEAKLKETVWQMEKLIETLPAKIFMKDKNNRYILVNSGFAHCIGLPPEKIKGYKSDEITVPKDFSIIVNQDSEILETGISYLNQDIFLENFDGTKNWYSVSQVPYGEEGKIMGIIGFMVDISKQKHYEKVLEEALNRTNIQKYELENSSRGMQESMKYAKRIQDTLLAPSNEIIHNYIPNSFIYDKPKDIVGGDFIYAAATADGIVCAVADCTGHGTPGALMSVMAISLLNDIFGMTIWKHTPADVLEELRRRVISTFSNSMVERESFDICMIFKEFNSDKIIYAGANLPLYICRENQLIKLEAVRCPIGAHPRQTAFVNYEFKIQKGDMLYLASDGYSDQFGHIENRRYYQSDFAQLLARISSKDLKTQKQILDEVHEDWKGDRKQTDDITIFGIKVSEINEENAI